MPETCKRYLDDSLDHAAQHTRASNLCTGIYCIISLEVCVVGSREVGGSAHKLRHSVGDGVEHHVGVLPRPLRQVLRYPPAAIIFTTGEAAGDRASQTNTTDLKATHSVSRSVLRDFKHLPAGTSWEFGAV